MSVRKLVKAGVAEPEGGEGTPLVYLDFNATSPLDPRVFAAMHDAASESWANPSSVHRAGRRARATVEQVREQLAAIFSAHPRDVVFTSGGTEANNLALRSASSVVTSRLEHPSVVRVAETLEQAGVPVFWAPVGEQGSVAPAAIAHCLERAPRGATVALMAVNHETGVIQPVPEVAAIARKAGARLHVDAVQALGRLETRAFTPADSWSVAAHKLGGPKGVGALIWSGASGNPGPLAGGATLKPVLVGGAQERGLRPGTLDAIAIAGFGTALSWIDEALARRAELSALRDRLEQVLSAHGQVNGAGAPRVAHVSNVSINGQRGDELVAALDLLGVCISSGSACSAGTTEPSPVIEAMCGSERAQSAIRVSLGRTTTQGAVAMAIDVFCRLLGVPESVSSGAGSGRDR